MQCFYDLDRHAACAPVKLSGENVISVIVLPLGPNLPLCCYWVPFWLCVATGSQSGSVLLLGPSLALCCYWVLISSHPHLPPPRLLSSISLSYLYIYTYIYVYTYNMNQAQIQEVGSYTCASTSPSRHTYSCDKDCPNATQAWLLLYC